MPVLAKQVIKEDYVAFQIKIRLYALDVQYQKQFETDVHITVQRLFKDHVFATSRPSSKHRDTDNRANVAPRPLG